MGGKRYSISTKIDRIPIFAKAGAVIPHFPVMQYTGEVPVKEITLNVYAGSGFGQCYLDAGDGYGYLKKDFKLCQYTTELSENGSLQIKQEQNGKYKADCKVYKLKLYGFESPPKEIMIDKKAYSCKNEDGILVIKKVPFKFSSIVVQPAG